MRRWGNMGTMGNGNDGDDMGRLDERERIDDGYDNGTDWNNGVGIRDAIARRRDKTRSKTIR